MDSQVPQHHGEPESPVALRLIAGLLLIGAVHLLRALVVPFTLAMVLAIALEPLVDRLTRRRMPNALASFLGMLLVALVVAGVCGLILYQAGTVLKDSDRYVAGFAQVLQKASHITGADGVLESLGIGPAQPAADAAPGAAGAGGYWEQTLRRDAALFTGWLATGLGGLMGFLGNLLIVLAFLFYMLLTRRDWIDRTSKAMRHLGMKPRRQSLQLIQDQLVTYVGRLALVSLGYVVVVTLGLWLIGVPQPLLWGVLTGVLEIVPYIGPVLAAALPAIVSLSSGSLGQPLAVIALFAVLQTVEGYVVAPLIYGSAIAMNPVTVLFGVLFFGWLLGPWGLVLAMPCLIILRGLLVLAPDTPALDAMLQADEQEVAASA